MDQFHSIHFVTRMRSVIKGNKHQLGLRPWYWYSSCLDRFVLMPDLLLFFCLQKGQSIKDGISLMKSFLNFPNIFLFLPHSNISFVCMTTRRACPCMFTKWRLQYLASHAKTLNSFCRSKSFYKATLIRALINNTIYPNKIPSYKIFQNNNFWKIYKCCKYSYKHNKIAKSSSTKFFFFFKFSILVLLNLMN